MCPKDARLPANFRAVHARKQLAHRGLWSKSFSTKFVIHVGPMRWMQVCRLIDSAKHWKFKNFQRGFPNAPSHTAACNELYMQNFVTRLFYTKHSLQSFGHKTWIWKPIKIIKTCIQLLNHSTSWNFTEKGQYSSIIPKLILKLLISINYMLRGVWNVQFLQSTFYSNAVSQQM